LNYLLQVQSNSPTEIKGTHETPKKHYVDDLIFNFTEDQVLHVCRVHVSLIFWHTFVAYSDERLLKFSSIS